MKRLLAVLILIAMATIAISGCSTQTAEKSSYEVDTLMNFAQSSSSSTSNPAEKVAEDFIRNSRVYSYDGSDLKLVSAEKKACDSCWEFTYTFRSKQEGFGERAASDKIILSEHIAEVLVSQGKVAGAIVDNEFNLVHQGELW